MAVNLTSVAMRKREVEEKQSLWDRTLQFQKIRKSQSNYIQELITQLQEREKQTLDLIKPGLTIEELRENIKKFHDSGFFRFSHKDVKVITETYDRTIKKENLMTAKAFTDWFNKYMPKELVQGMAEQKGQTLGQAYEDLILSIVNKSELRQITQTGKQGRVQTHSRISSFIDNNPDWVPEQILNILGKVTQERIKRHAKLPNATDLTHSVYVDLGAQTINVDIPTDESFEYIDWYGLTRRGLTQSQAKERVQKGRININNLKKAFVDAIVNYICQEKSLPLDRSVIQTIVNYVATTDNYAFFVGENDKLITGLLGEIQALCYLACLNGGTFDPKSKQIQWAATQKLAGQEYHADIILNQAYGIQVKNTTKDIVDKIDFLKNKHLKTILDELVAMGRLEKTEANTIIDIFATRYFNIPYLHSSTNYSQLESVVDSPSKNSEYVGVWNKLTKYIQIAEKIFKFLFDYFMYIGVGNASKNERGNVLFFLGGNVVLLASEICLSLINEINRASFIIERPQEGVEGIENIVTFANNKNLVRSNEKGQYVLNSNKMPKHMVHEAITDKIILNSSFDFTNVINEIQNNKYQKNPVFYPILLF